MRVWFGWGALVAALGNPLALEVGAPLQAQTSSGLIDELGCAACHVGLASSADLIRERTPTLQGAATRYDGAFVFGFLRTPAVEARIGRSRMPDFGLDDRESLALAAYLSNGRSDLGGDASRDYDRARREHPDITAEMGRALFQGLRCTACHQGNDGIRAPRDAPDLSLAVISGWC